MAKKSKSSHSPAAPATVSANRLRLAVVSVPRLSPTSLRELEDRRLFSPDKSVRGPASIRRQQARLTQPVRRAKNPHRPSPLHALPAFHMPERVALCVRRKIRKEVLHAFKVAGKSGLKKPRRNFWSKVKC